MQKQDKCVVITVAESLVNKDKVHAEIDKLAAEYGCKNVEKVILEHPKQLSVYKTIQAFLQSQSEVGDDGIAHQYIDYVCVGNSGLGFDPRTHEPNYLGSVAGMVLRAKRMNCLFIPS